MRKLKCFIGLHNWKYGFGVVELWGIGSRKMKFRIQACHDCGAMFHEDLNPKCGNESIKMKFKKYLDLPLPEKLEFVYKCKNVE